MKFSKYVMCAGLVALMASCASDEPVVNPYAMPEEVAAVDSYARFTIALPEDAGTRADDDVTFVGGEASEYLIQNGKLLIFTKADENVSDADATFVEEVDITGAFYSDTDLNADISREAKEVEVKFPKGTFEKGKLYYAVVALNTSDNYTKPEGKTLKEWNETETTKPYWYASNGKNYLTFTSASRYDETTKTGSVLTAIDPEKVKSTPDAVTEAVADLYVQRVMAKVSFNADPKYTIGKDEAKVTDWAVDLTSKDANRLQVTAGLETVLAKSYGHSAKVNDGDFQRCHWTKSTNYGILAASGDNKWDNKLNHPATPAWKALTDNNYQYVNENTNPWNMMMEAYNTRVLVKVQYTPSELKGTQEKDFIVIEGSAKRWTVAEFEEAVYTKVKNIETAGFVPAEGGVKFTKTAGGLYSFKECFKITDAAGEELENATLLNTIAEQIGIEGNADTKAINFYKDGNCYYSVWVRHFNDSNNDIKWNPNENGGAYAEKHEGRYGVVRNNWYDMTIQNISGLGKPSTNELEPDPNQPIDKIDDKGENLKVNLKMLNWTKRNQNVNL